MKKMCLEKSSKEAPQICPSQKKVCWEKKNSKEILKVCHSKKIAISNVAPLNFGPYTNSFQIFYLLPLRLKFMKTSKSSFTKR